MKVLQTLEKTDILSCTQFMAFPLITSTSCLYTHLTAYQAHCYVELESQRPLKWGHRQVVQHVAVQVREVNAAHNSALSPGANSTVTYLPNVLRFLYASHTNLDEENLLFVGNMEQSES